MKRKLIWALGFVAVLASSPVYASICEVGDLNIINDPGNPSDGLRYLDMTFSVGLSLAAALTNAQGTYPDTRLAMPSEWDDLFAAAGVTYSGTATDSDAFTVGGNLLISVTAVPIFTVLGETVPGGEMNVWSDPDSDNTGVTTRDFLQLKLSIPSGAASIFNIGIAAPQAGTGWMLVSDATVVPLPPAILFLASGVVGLLLRRTRAEAPAFAVSA